MKNSLLLGTTLGILLLAGTASAATTQYAATLDGKSEVAAPGTTLPATSTATGTAALTFDDAAKTLKGTVSWTNMSAKPELAHIHSGDCATAGAAEVPLTITEGTAAAGTITVDEELDDGQVADLIAKKLYVNLHTATGTTYANGEIRGQLHLTSDTVACPVAADGGASSSGGSSSGGSSSGSTSGDTTPPAGTDAGTSSSGGTSSSSGCATTSSTPTGSLALVLGVGLAITALSRRRKK